MNFELFGIQVSTGKDKEDLPEDKLTFKEGTDGSKDIITYGAAGGHRFVEVYQGNVVPRKEIDLIKKYRQVARLTEVERAVSEITNDAITYDDVEKFPVKVSLDDVEGISSSTKDKISKEFDELLSIMEFDLYGYDYFYQWYVDGRAYFNIVADENTEEEDDNGNGKNKKKRSDGIKEINHIDSLFIKKIREIIKNADGVITDIKEYFLYVPEHLDTELGQVQAGTKNVIKFNPDAVVFVTSGLFCKEDRLVLSHLHKAIKPANQLAMIEDAIVIYRVSRAPERRIFYIDVGTLPKTAAEEYLNTTMNRYRNKVAYNTTTGEINDQKNVMSMLEDFWLPRREGGRGTEITTLAGGENLGQLEDVVYFRKKLYDSLNVPNARMESESMFTLGRDSEISREEVKFAKFIDRLRKRFAKGIFTNILKVQCIMKNIVANDDDWTKIERGLKFIFVEDSHFAELKKIQVLNDRVAVVNDMAELIGTYFSKDFVRKNIFNQTEEEITQLKKDREKEEKEEPDETEDDGGGFGGGEEGGFGGGQPSTPETGPKVGPKVGGGGGEEGEEGEEDEDTAKTKKQTGDNK